MAARPGRLNPVRLFTTPRSSRRGRLLAMYYDPQTGRGPLAPWQKAFCAGLLAVVVGWLLYETCRDFEPAKLAPVLLILFWMPLMVLHEAGHAVVARLVGWHVGKVVLGMGPRLA